MNENDRRSAMAESMGWKKRQLGQVFVYYQENAPDKIHGVIPDYLRDLNAMHDAEKTLTPKEQSVFANELRKILGFHQHTYFELAHATAAQRCEAYLRVKNLWKE